MSDSNETSSALEYAKRISRAVREGTYTPPEMTVKQQGGAHLLVKIERRCPKSKDTNDVSQESPFHTTLQAKDEQKDE